MWNVSKASDDKEVIPLRVNLQVVSDDADLWDSPDRRKKIASLPRGTTLGRIAKTNAKAGNGWASVIVTSVGPNTGKTGWLTERDINLPLAMIAALGAGLLDLAAPKPADPKKQQSK